MSDSRVMKVARVTTARSKENNLEVVEVFISDEDIEYWHTLDDAVVKIGHTPDGRVMKIMVIGPYNFLGA